MTRAILGLVGLLLAAAVGWAEYVVIRVNLAASESGAAPSSSRTPAGFPPGFAPPGGPGRAPVRQNSSRPRTTPGAFPFAPGGPARNVPNEELEEPDKGPVWFIAVVEADDVRKNKFNYYAIKHKWDGEVVLPKVMFSGGEASKSANTGPIAPGFPGARPPRTQGKSSAETPEPTITSENDVAIRVDVIDQSAADFLRPRFDKRRKDLEELVNDKKTLSLANALKLADWTLQHWNYPLKVFLDDARNRYGDMIAAKEFEALVDEMAKMKSADPRVKALVATKQGLRQSLAKPDEDLTKLKAFLGRDYYETDSPHWVMLSSSREPRTLDNKLKRLEHAFTGFHYWFALRGIPLPMPAKKLICVYADNSKGADDSRNFDEIHQILETVPMVVDGFYSRLDNVGVYCNTRLDDSYQQLLTVISGLESQEIDREYLLAGRELPKSVREEIRENKNLLMYGTALALASRAGLDEGEVSTFTHEGALQTAIASGLLPARVHVPKAVRFGLGSFFETPKSAFIPAIEPLAKNGAFELPTLWAGIGNANWVHLPVFRAVTNHEGKELVSGANTPFERRIKIPPLNITSIITDQNWLAAEKADPQDREFFRAKARAEAWALTFFFARERTDGLMKFYAELSRLPRDMDLTDEMVIGAFARGFGIQDAKDPFKVDAGKLKALENAWRQFMNYQALELPIQLDSAPRKPPTEAKNPNPARNPYAPRY